MIPERYGGLGLDLTTYALIVKELSRGWISQSGVINTHFIASFMLTEFGTEEQEARAAAADGPRGAAQRVLDDRVDGFRVPAAMVLGGPDGEGRGFRQFMVGIELGRVNIAARAIGIAVSAFEHSIRYAQERDAFGKPIANHQLIQSKLARWRPRSAPPSC